MEKVIRDGKVAVLYSPGFGAGWSTWNDDSIREILLFSPQLVEMVEADTTHMIDDDWMLEVMGLDDVCCIAAPDLSIMWLDVGTQFRIREERGSESVRCLHDESYYTA